MSDSQRAIRGRWRAIRRAALKQAARAGRVIARHPSRKSKPAKPVVMFDSIDIGTIPRYAGAVAGYTSGNWPTYSKLVLAFPKARHLSIAVNASHDAECLDCEPGDATPGQAPAWVKRQRQRGIKRPVIYASVSQMPQVLAALKDAGIPRSAVRLWTAHYTFKQHLCGPHCGFGFNTTADATQWTDKSQGRNLDESICAPGFWS